MDIPEDQKSVADLVAEKQTEDRVPHRPGCRMPGCEGECWTGTGYSPAEERAMTEDRVPTPEAVNRIVAHLWGEDFVNIRAAVELFGNGWTVVPKTEDRVRSHTHLFDQTDPDLCRCGYRSAWTSEQPAPPLDVLRRLVEAWDAMYGKVRFTGTSPDSVDLGLAFDRIMDEARERLAGDD